MANALSVLGTGGAHTNVCIGTCILFVGNLYLFFFQTIVSTHSYCTRYVCKSTYGINIIKTNYGKSNFCFAAVKVLNQLDERI